MDPLLQNFPTFVTCLARSGRRKYLIVVVTHISAGMDGYKSCIETSNKKNNPCEGGSLWQNKMRQTKLILDFELYLHNVLVLTERQVRPCRPGLFRPSSVSWNYLPGLLAAWHNLAQFGMQHPPNHATMQYPPNHHHHTLLYHYSTSDPLWPPRSTARNIALTCKKTYSADIYEM